MSGRVGDLSTKQAAALAELKVNVSDVIQPHHDDYFLLRWLRARSFNVKKSESMLRNSLEWRRKYCIDTIIENWTPGEVLTRYFPGGLTDFVDKEGCPIMILAPGYIDAKGMLSSEKKDNIIKYPMLWCEKLYKRFDEISCKFNKRVDRLCLIIDLEKFNISHLWKPEMDVNMEMLGLFESNYPETLKCCYFINVPSVFPILYNIMKVALNQDTRRKLKVIGGNWKEKLQQEIDADQLPIHWGGTRSENDGQDPFCLSQICMGGPIPDEFQSKINFVDMSKFTKDTVKRGSTVHVDFDIRKPGSVLRWQFHSEGDDIAFGIFYRASTERMKAKEMEEVLETKRVNSHMIPEDGSYTCDKPGIYVLRFSNRYSWVKSKSIYYLVEVLEDQDLSDIGQA